MRLGWRSAGALVFVFILGRASVAACQEAGAPPSARPVSIALAPVLIETGTPGGQVWLRPTYGVHPRIWCKSPCMLMLYPSQYDVVVDEPGRVRLREDIVIEESTRGLTFKPRTELGDVVTAFALATGPLAILTGVTVGGIRGAGCEERATDDHSCTNRAMMSAWPIWGAGILLTGIGLFSLISNRATITVRP